MPPDERSRPRQGAAPNKIAAGGSSLPMLPPYPDALPRYIGADDEPLDLALSRNTKDERHLHWDQTDPPTWAEFVGMTDDANDLPMEKYAAGGYVAGLLRQVPGRRCSCPKLHKNRDAIVYRSLLTGDADDVDEGFVDRVKALGYSGVVYSSASHDPDGPKGRRYRVVLRPDRGVLPEEYGPIMRWLMRRVGGNWDAGSAQPERTMYLPAAVNPDNFERYVLAGALVDVDAAVEAADLLSGPVHPSSGPRSAPADTSTPPTPQELQRATALLETWAQHLATHAGGDAMTKGRNDYMLSRSKVLYQFVLGGCLEEQQVQDRMREAYAASGAEAERGDFGHTDNNAMAYAEDAGAARPWIEDPAEVFGAEPGGCAFPGCPNPARGSCTSEDGVRFYILTCAEHDGADTDAAHQAAAEEKAVEASTWKRQDVGAVLDQIEAGEDTRPVPTVCKMAGGGCLFYPGRISTVFGESGSAKTWIVLVAVKQEIEAGRHVFFIDFEDDLASAVHRLLTIGTNSGAIRERFHYIAPEEALNKRVRQKLIRTLAEVQPSLVVIDSTGESMAVEGLNPYNDDVAIWNRLLPKAATRCGAAVAVVDHIPKDQANNGAPIGSQRKRAGVFAAYRVETVDEFARGTAGSSRIVANKGKGGNHRKGEVIGVLRAQPDADAGEGRMEMWLAEVDVPTPEERRDANRERLKLKASGYVRQQAEQWKEHPDNDGSEHNGLSMTAIREGIGGSKTDVLPAIKELVRDGYLVPTTASKNQQNPKYTHGREYVESAFEAVEDEAGADGS